MHIHLPNSAHLGNLEGFLKQISIDDPSRLVVTMNPKWVSVHPVVLSMVAAAGAQVHSVGGEVKVDFSSARSVAYLVRMGLPERLGVDPPLSVTEHEPAGRFIPLTQVRTGDDLENFLVEMVPLLHAPPEAAKPIRYLVSELVRNALEHSASSAGAFVCAQYFAKSERLSLGVADRGIGIRATMARHHVVRSDLEAIQKAMRPGISGTSATFGGTEYNAGAGLFFVKSIAAFSHNFLVAYSGTGMFKLLKQRADAGVTIFPNAESDRATRLQELPDWAGTVMGIDIGVREAGSFDLLLRAIQDAYHLEIRTTKKAMQKARFTT
jgi:anti-sigma regulatory factor (Ser/Thr protein kinase)